MADVIAAAFAAIGFGLIAIAVIRGRRPVTRLHRPNLPSFITKE